jgi:hypothetical protein
VSSLDLLDYQVGLDAALATPGPDGKPLLAPGLRRQAVKEARRVVDAMAFRFALMDERPLPEDLDYLRALEAMKPPVQAAAVLARRRAHYARTRVRRLVTTWATLAIVASLVATLALLATSEESVPLASINHSTAAEETSSPNATFVVDANVTRLHLDGTLLLAKGSPGNIEVRLVDPAGVVLDLTPTRGNVYLRENVESPKPGTWTLLVDFNGAHGSARVDVFGVRPTR